MKRLFAFFLVIVICSCAAFNARRVVGEGDGEILEGVGQGFRGPISVQVRLNEGSITEIEIVDSMEDRFVGGSAIEELIDLVIMYNSTDIDAVSGATESSEGFLEAVRNAILKR
jgi:urocanate reductase